MRYLFFSIFLFSVMASAQPETTPPLEYDLSTAVHTALQQHPSLRGAQAQIAGAQAQLRGAQSARAPRLTANAGYTQLQEEPSFTVTPLGTLVFGEKDNPQASLTLQWPLYTGGRAAGQTRQAKAGIDAARHGLTRRQQQVARDATTAFYNVLKARGFVEVAQSQLRSLEAQRSDIAKMLERGVTTRLDFLRAETSVAGAQEALTKARNGETVAIVALSTAMGFRANPALKVSGRGASVIELPLTVEASVEEALQGRVELHQLEAQRVSARAGEQIAGSARRPSIGAFAQLDAERPTFMPNTGHWSAGVAVTLPLFDGGAASAAKAQARSQVEQIEAAQDELRNDIAMQATAAWLNVQSARERLATTEKAVASAEEGVRLVRMGYGNGVNTITDFLAAQAELSRAQNDRVTALFDLRAAETDLHYALGRNAA